MRRSPAWLFLIFQLLPQLFAAVPTGGIGSLAGDQAEAKRRVCRCPIFLSARTRS